MKTLDLNTVLDGYNVTVGQVIKDTDNACRKVSKMSLKDKMEFLLKIRNEFNMNDKGSTITPT